MLRRRPFEVNAFIFFLKDTLKQELCGAPHSSAGSRMYGSSLSRCHSRLTRAAQHKEHASTLLLSPPQMHLHTPFPALSTKDSSSAALLLLVGCSKRGRKTRVSHGTVGGVGVQGVTSLDSQLQAPLPVSSTSKQQSENPKP